MPGKFFYLIFYIAHKVVRDRKDVHAIGNYDMKIQSKGILVRDLN